MALAGLDQIGAAQRCQRLVVQALQDLEAEGLAAVGVPRGLHGPIVMAAGAQAEPVPLMLRLDVGSARHPDVTGRRAANRIDSGDGLLLLEISDGLSAGVLVHGPRLTPTAIEVNFTRTK